MILKKNQGRPIGSPFFILTGFPPAGVCGAAGGAGRTLQRTGGE